MILYPEEKVIKHKGEEYTFDQDAVQYCAVPNGYYERLLSTGETYSFPMYIDVDILQALVGVASGDLTVEEAFVSIKEAVKIHDQYKACK